MSFLFTFKIHCLNDLILIQSKKCLKNTVMSIINTSVNDVNYTRRKCTTCFLSDIWLNPPLVIFQHRLIKIKSNQINFIPIMGPRGANRNYTYSKITHINSQEGKSWWLIEHDMSSIFSFLNFIIEFVLLHHDLGN